MTKGRTILYLHGLASSPRGRKRALLAGIFGPDGILVAAPDLNAPSFRELSFSAIERKAVEAVGEAEPAVIVGSSLGGLVALSVARSPEGAGIPLVLLAPALGFRERWRDGMPDGEPLEMFHHGEGRPLPIHRRFFEEMAAVTVDLEPPPVPVSVVMGEKDESVPFAQVRETWEAWEAGNRLIPGSRFHAVPDGNHDLLGHAGWIEEAVRERLRETN